MTILITADWHLSSNPRDEYRFYFVEKTLPRLIEEHRVKLLLFLGDVTEIKDGHEAELVNRIVANFHNLSELCPVVCLQGNHDWLSSPDNPYFGFLSRLERVSWVKAPIPLANIDIVPESLSKMAKGCFLLPHSSNPDRDWGEIDFGEYDWVFAHQSFAGAVSESGYQLGGVSMAWFPKGTRVIAGDIHQPQEAGPLTYVGSPYSVDFGDEIEPRVLLMKPDSLRSIPVAGPQKRLIEGGCLQDVYDRKGLRKGDLIKVRLEVGSYDEWPKALKEVQAWAAEKGLVLHQAQPLIQSPLATKVTLDKKATKTDEELLGEYAKKRQLADGYLNTGLKLL